MSEVNDKPTGKAPGQRERRKITLIKKSFQLKAFLFIFLVTLAGLSLHSFLIVQFVSMGEGLTLEILAQTFIGATILLIVLDYVMGILGTHLVAGPIYKFQCFIKKIAKGDFSGEVFLRKGDALGDVADDLNLALTGLRSFVERDRVLLSEVRQEVTDALEGRPELPSIMEKIDHITKAYRVSEDDPVPSLEKVRQTSSV